MGNVSSPHLKDRANIVKKALFIGIMARGGARKEVPNDG
jgi:hypothetical protein